MTDIDRWRADRNDSRAHLDEISHRMDQDEINRNRGFLDEAMRKYRRWDRDYLDRLEFFEDR